MEYTEKIINYVLLYIVSMIVLIWTIIKKQIGVGITLSYAAQFFIVHFLSIILYIIPWYIDRVDNTTLEWTVTGFEKTSYGFAAFAIGNIFIAPFFKKVIEELPSISKKYQGQQYNDYKKLPEIYIIVGLLSYWVFSYLFSGIPTLHAIIAVGQQLIIVGLCLACWRAWKNNSMGEFIIWLSVSFLFPFLTIITRGFLGYGITSLLIVLIFAFNLFKKRWITIFLFFVIGYLGLSLYVSYMRDRGIIREIVWSGRSYEDRINQIIDTIINFEAFDIRNITHLHTIDDRLNQNRLIGASVYYLARSQEFANGSTLWESILALVPRVIWPEKPVYAGSSDLVSRFTGLRFAEGTSVGIGHVMEFYVNFGTLGVVIGFVVLGILIALIDDAAKHNLNKNNWRNFSLWFLIGISFLQVGGSLVELTGSSAASVVVYVLLNKYLIVYLSKKDKNT
ncbi:MAG: O-antigen polysaccharide polymerase Wzy [Rhodothermia bacterium]|nr:O-antigen polysaccharide polymerase Wzy [Rhodothermia bacterium]